MAVKSSDEPPREIIGRVCPVSGMMFTVTMMCSRACPVMSSAMPSDSMAGYFLGQRSNISMARKNTHTYNAMSIIAMPMPYSSTKKAKA